jgi:hypothetical protein
MADRYWVGGAGTWDATTTTNWATSSGGAGGAGVPTSADNAYFDGASDTGAAFTVTIGTGATCADVIIGDGTIVSVLDQTMTLAGTDELTIHGSWFNPATNYTRTYTGRMTFAATTSGHTFTTNGIALNNILNFNGENGEWTLGSAITNNSDSAEAFDVLQGTFNTGNYNYTGQRQVVNSTGDLVRTVNLGSSTLTCTGAGVRVPVRLSGSNLTFNAGTSQINITNAGQTGTFFGGGYTFYNVTYTQLSSVADPLISGNNTFNNLTLTSRNDTGKAQVRFSENQTINGIFSANSGTTSLIQRTALVSNTVGTPITITAATIAFNLGLDFRDITAAGAASPWDVSALGGGNCGGNTNITFPAAKTVYRRGTGNWSATQWSDSSGGTAAVQWFPLAQDTMVFDANTTTGTHTIDGRWNLGTLDMTNSTTVTLASGTQIFTFYGNITLSNVVTPSGTGVITFSGRSTQTITSSGRTFTQPITINSPNETVQLLDNLTVDSVRTVTLTAGTLDLSSGNRTLSTGLFNSNNTNTRSILFGTGNITVTGNAAAIWNTGNTTNFSYTGTPTINLTYSGSTGTRTIATARTSTGGTEANSISFNVTAGTDIVAFGSTSFLAKTIDFTGFSGTFTPNGCFIFGDLVISSGMSLTASASGIGFIGSTPQLVTTAGKTFDFPLTFGTATFVPTVVFQDALTQGSTQAFTFTNGTVQLKNGVTSTVGAFATSGTNQKFLQSTTLGSQATLSQASGTVDASYLTIRDINAVGGATWNAFVNQQNIDAGNNDGWDFGISPIVGSYEYTYQLRSFTQPRRF